MPAVNVLTLDEPTSNVCMCTSTICHRSDLLFVKKSLEERCHPCPARLIIQSSVSRWLRPIMIDQASFRFISSSVQSQETLSMATSVYHSVCTLSSIEWVATTVRDVSISSLLTYHKRMRSSIKYLTHSPAKRTAFNRLAHPQATWNMLIHVELPLLQAAFHALQVKQWVLPWKSKTFVDQGIRRIRNVRCFPTSLKRLSPSPLHHITFLSSCLTVVQPRCRAHSRFIDTTHVFLAIRMQIDESSRASQQWW
jgi:hypothetical protein